MPSLLIGFFLCFAPLLAPCIQSLTKPLVTRKTSLAIRFRASVERIYREVFFLFFFSAVLILVVGFGGGLSFPSDNGF